MSNGLPCFFTDFSFTFLLSIVSSVFVGVITHDLMTIRVVVCDVLEPGVNRQVFTVQQAYHLFVDDGVFVWRSDRKYPPHFFTVCQSLCLFRIMLEINPFTLCLR